MVREAMVRVMQQRFGLSEQEQDTYLEPYTRSMSSLDNDTEF